MKRISFVAGFVGIFFIMNCGISSAEQTAGNGAGQRGVTLSFAYDGNYFAYEEIVDGEILDKDSGWINGFFFEGRYDNRKLFARGSVDISGSNSATYKGSLQDGTPITMTTSEFFYQIEGAFGFKALNFSTATLTPYAALGFRYWARGEDRLPDYLETYTWGYLGLGANFAYRVGRALVGLDAAVQFPIDPQMQTDTAGLYDTATFKLKAKPGFHLEVPISYDMNKPGRRTTSLFVRPYYQRWNIGASDPVTLTRNGIPTDVAFEPDSHTNIYGFKLGVAINF